LEKASFMTLFWSLVAWVKDGGYASSNKIHGRWSTAVRILRLREGCNQATGAPSFAFFAKGGNRDVGSEVCSAWSTPPRHPGSHPSPKTRRMGDPSSVTGEEKLQVPPLRCAIEKKVSGMFFSSPSVGRRPITSPVGMRKRGAVLGSGFGAGAPFRFGLCMVGGASFRGG
jgi:hypothetical protein